MQDFRQLRIYVFGNKLKNAINMKLSDQLKKAQTLVLAMGALLSLPLFQSCLDDGDAYDPSIMYPNAIVTVKPVTDAENGDYHYFQLDDNTKLWPLDNSSLPYGDKEVRAFVNYTEVEMPAGVDTEVYSKAVQVNWRDTILTKPAVATKGTTEDDIEAYGDDGVEILKDWTVVEDGYFTIHFYTRWGNTNTKHEVNLVTGTNPDDPYEVVFRHNNFDDPEYYESDGIAAFRLSDLPDTQGKTVTMTLKWKNLAGETKSVQFKYKTRVD